VYLHWEMPH
jgi:hypothetical protein